MVIAEPGHEDQVGDHDLVLGVSVHAARDAVELIRRCCTQGAAAVLLKPLLSARSAVHFMAPTAQVAVVEVHAGAAWAQVVRLLRRVLDAAANELEGTR